MKSKKLKLVTSGVASPIPTGRKDCGGRRDRQMLSEPLAGKFPDTHGRKGHGGNDPLEGFELTQRLAFLNTMRTIRRCYGRPLLRRERRAPRIKGQAALVFETPHGRYGAFRRASPWAWASWRDLIPSG